MPSGKKNEDNIIGGLKSVNSKDYCFRFESLCVSLISLWRAWFFLVSSWSEARDPGDGVLNNRCQNKDDRLPDDSKQDDVPYRPRNVWKASVRREGEVITKEYTGAPFIPRLFGRLSLSCEEAALRKLEGLPGVPSLVSRPSPHAIQISAVKGRPLDKMEKGELSESCFQRLVSLIHRIHDRGVAHGDLHQRNILVDQDRPSVIDFSTAYVKGRVPWLDGWILRKIILLDLERLYKVEKKFFDRGDPPRMFLLYRVIKRFR